jgi:prepilin-type N-terminal cleavage/methylation domain-containing protein
MGSVEEKELHPMLGTFRRNDARGYTLIELVVVMALLAGLSGMVLPSLYSGYQRMAADYEKTDLTKNLSKFGYIAFKKRQQIILEADATEVVYAEFPDLPQGWKFFVEGRVSYYPTGVCGGGRITLKKGVVDSKMIMAPPFCRLVSMEAE